MSLHIILQSGGTVLLVGIRLNGYQKRTGLGSQSKGIALCAFVRSWTRRLCWSSCIPLQANLAQRLLSIYHPCHLENVLRPFNVPNNKLIANKTPGPEIHWYNFTSWMNPKIVQLRQLKIYFILLKSPLKKCHSTSLKKCYIYKWY